MDVAPGILAGLLLAALLAGWVDAVVGGGGLIQLPSLLIGLPSDTPVPTVSGTNKISSVFGTGTAALTYALRTAVDWRTAAVLVPSSALGSALGARLVQHVPRAVFTPLVLVVVVGVGLYTLRRPSLGMAAGRRRPGRRHLAGAGGIGVGIGVYDGLIGPGTGTFFVIALVAVLGYEFLAATALTKLANLTTNLAAIAVLGPQGHILWGLGLAMAAANLAGGFLGAHMAVRHGNRFVRQVFLVVLAVLSLKLAVDSLAMAF